MKTTTVVLRSPKWSSQFRPYGAYVDEINFFVYSEGKTPSAISALQNGDIDAYDGQVEWNHVVPLLNNPKIQVTFTPNLRYQALLINCGKFPTNITAFRRAMAFGFDKYLAAQECIEGVCLLLDSLVPIAATGWEIESKQTIHFYEPDYISGNKSLENAGFRDLDGDGWREYDKNNNGVWDPGVDFDDDEYADGDVLVMVTEPDYDPHVITCQIMQESLARMGIQSYLYVGYFECPIICGIWSGEDHVLPWIENRRIRNTPKFLYDNFRTGAKWNKDPYNFHHFSNATIDAFLDQMISSITLTDIKEYSTEAANLLAFEQPEIAIYNEFSIHTYRTDRFEGFFEFAGLGTPSGKNNYIATKVHLKESSGGPYGNTFKYSLSDDIGTLNPYLQRTEYDATVFQYIYEKLWNIDPYTWVPIPGLAYNWEIEQTTANGEIHDGQKFTFYLYENETWHDGEPFTAADVNHSLHLWQNSPRSGPEMADVYKVKMPEGADGHIIEFYVNKTGYFEWVDTTQFYITPEHIWQDVTNVSAFNPNNDQIIGTGPYKWGERVLGENISLHYHENWRWTVRNDSPPKSEGTLTEEVSSTQSSGTTLDLDPILQIVELAAILFFVVTMLFLIRRHQKNLD
ncbi:MAG: ABC transporter substrate-binding protein [Candidatus Hodarchaeota archaeon]